MNCGKINYLVNFIMNTKPKFNAEKLRSSIQSLVNKNLIASAIFLAEKLVILSDCAISDYVTYSKCFYLNGEPRRCLASLEQNDLLSAKRIQKLYEYIKQPFNANQLSETDTNDIKTEIEIILLAAQCLFSIQEYDDCINLLYPIISLDEVFEMSKISLVQQFKFVHKIFRKTKQDVDDMAGIFCIAGKCFDALENRSKSIKFLSIALGIDIACIEAAEYMIEHGMLLTKEKQIIFQNLHSNCSESKEWLLPFYRTMFLNENPLMLVFQLNENQIMSNNNDKDDRNSDLLQQYTVDSKCASWLVQLSEYYFDHQQIDESYLFARKAYTIDPYNNRGLLSYIAGLVELNLKTELFYLGHELVYSTPKSAISWYAVGCYYWCCCKFETAQKYFQKTLKLDKKLANAYIMLGHVLCAQEESEQAISAYRTATRLLPTDHRPIVYMAKEMIRTNYSTLAQQLLIGALNICSTDATLFNEIAVIYQKHGRLDMAKQYLEYAISTYYKSTQQNQHNFKNSSKTKLTFLDFSIKGALQDNKFPYRRNCTVEIFNNYATVLRKMGLYESSLYWYLKCLSVDPLDANIHASLGFTFHLMQRFDSAILYYHKALALNQNLTICSEMLNRAMIDSNTINSMFFNTTDANNSSEDNEEDKAQLSIDISDNKKMGDIQNDFIANDREDYDLATSFSINNNNGNVMDTKKNIFNIGKHRKYLFGSSSNNNLKKVNSPIIQKSKTKINNINNNNNNMNSIIHSTPKKAKNHNSFIQYFDSDNDDSHSNNNNNNNYYSNETREDDHHMQIDHHHANKSTISAASNVYGYKKNLFSSPERSSQSMQHNNDEQDEGNNEYLMYTNSSVESYSRVVGKLSISNSMDDDT